MIATFGQKPSSAVRRPCAPGGGRQGRQKLWKEVKERMKRYEAIKLQVQKLEERRRDLLAKLATQEREAAKALLEGREVPPRDDRLKSEIERLDRAIELGQEELAALELDHIYEALAEVRRDEEKLAAALRELDTAFDKKREDFRTEEQKYAKARAELADRLERLSDKRMSLEREAQQLQAAVDPVLIADAVPKFLDAFRKGEIRDFIRGVDPAQDKAYELYEAEVREIREWHRRNAIAKRTTGESVRPPACMQHYPKERVDEIVRPMPLI